MTLGHEKQFQDESLASHFFDIYVEREKKRKSSTRHIHVPPESLYFIFGSFHIGSCFNVILGTENGRNIITNISICYLTVKTTTTKPAGKMREKMRADTKLLHQQEKLYNGSLDGEWRTTLLIISSHWRQKTKQAFYPTIFLTRKWNCFVRDPRTKIGNRENLH